jgi:deoxyribose-phosphate aldolase
MLTGADLAAKIDHTLLKPAASAVEIERHCREAIEHGFRGVVLHPAHLRRAAEVLEGSGVVLSSVIAFPHGATTLLGKIFEALEAWKLGAVELDIVLSLSAIAAGDSDALDEEIRTLMEKTSECRQKFILETGLFDDRALRRVLRLLDRRGPAFVKTSTGAGPPGATPEVVRLLRASLRRSIGVKASGGIRTLEQAEALLAAGADLIGTSAGLSILAEAARR